MTMTTAKPLTAPMRITSTMVHTCPRSNLWPDLDVRAQPTRASGLHGIVRQGSCPSNARAR
eukprot:335416-Pyramimonas_sp.AAC.1